jgi:N4-gp56 family major capsid protein
MKTFYDMTLIDEATAQLVHDQFGQKRPIPAGGGKTIEFRKFSQLPKALTPLTEGVTPSGQDVTVTAITSTVAQYGDYIVSSDVLELTALDNIILENTKLLGKQAGLTLDTVTREIINAGTNVSYASAWSGTTEVAVTARKGLDTTAKITVDAIQRVVAKLRAQNAPTINGDYVGIIHPYIAYDLMRDPEWVDSHKYAVPENLYQGEIGKVGGVRFVQSTEAKIFKGADLGSDSRTLTINGAVSANATTAVLDGGTFAANALAGRAILVGGNVYHVASNTASSGTATITLATGEKFAAIADNTVVYPGEGGKDGIAVFSTLILGDGAYGVTEITGGGLQTIVKQKGSAGSADPLDQRSSVGWKAIKTAEILVDEYMVRLETASSRWSTTVQAN